MYAIHFHTQTKMTKNILTCKSLFYFIFFSIHPGKSRFSRNIHQTWQKKKKNTIRLGTNSHINARQSNPVGGKVFQEHRIESEILPTTTVRSPTWAPTYTTITLTEYLWENYLMIWASKEEGRNGTKAHWFHWDLSSFT